MGGGSSAAICSACEVRPVRLVGSTVSHRGGRSKTDAFGVPGIHSWKSYRHSSAAAGFQIANQASSASQRSELRMCCDAGPAKAVIRQMEAHQNGCRPMRSLRVSHIDQRLRPSCLLTHQEQR